MKTNNQIIIDEWLVRPAVSILNILVKLLGKILRINHNLKGEDFKTIAICKYKGMGSILQATPLLSSLKKSYPNAKIIFITTSGNKRILEKTGLIDCIITLNDSSVLKLCFGFPGFIYRLIRLKIEVYIDLEVYSNFSTLVTILSKAKNRLGFYLQSKHYRLGNYTHMMYHNTHSPIMETYLQFARMCGCNIETTGLVNLPQESKIIEVNKDKIELDKLNYLVINPNASDLRLERRWGRESYLALIKHLTSEYPDYKLFVIGGKNEANYVDLVLNNWKHPQVINLAGKTNLDQLIAIIQHTKLMITNDSGPMHIAFACKIPVICLFGPCSPTQYGNHSNAVSVYKKAYCSPCIHDFVNPPCRGNNMCMQIISVNEVFNTVKSFFNEGLLATQKETIHYTHKNFVFGTLNRIHKDS